jgi:vacuolar-type H+-ATPase subunit I/STV1
LDVAEPARRAREEMLMEGIRKYNARLDEDKRLARLEYHEGQIARLSSTLGALIASHEAEAAKYRQSNGHHEKRST